MRIRMIRFGGIDDRNQRLEAGVTFDVSEPLARDLLGRGWAVPSPPQVEATVVGPAENAAKRIGKPPRRRGA